MEWLCILFVALLGLVHSQAKTPHIYYLHVKSDIRYRFATTLVTSKVANSELSPIETHFEVTLPDAAFITEFVMEIDGKHYPGEIKEKAKAKEQYEAAKSRGQSAGHIAQKPRHSNRFSVNVNIAAESKVTFNLTYQELLERVYGEYEHIIYIDTGQIVKDFRIEVAIQESRELTKVSVPPIRNDVIADSSIEEGVNALVVIERPTSQSATIHYSPTIDDQKQQSKQGISGLFVVEYDVNRTNDAGEVLVVDGYFVHFFAMDDMNPIPKDVLFILDVSGSMNGKKMNQQKDAMNAILKDLHEGDRFNVMKFSSDAVMWQSTLLLANRKNKKIATDYINTLVARGYTNINAAMLRGIEFMNNIDDERDQRKIIIFLTDGEATTGEKKPGQFYKTLAFGADADYEFIKKVAIQNKGIGRKIFEDADASLQIRDFYNEISSSTLRNVTFKYLDNGNDVAKNTTRLNFDTYFDKKELVIAGKLSSEDDILHLTLIVTGNGKDGVIQLTGESDINPDSTMTKKGDFHKITERMWAYLTIKQLLEKAIGESDTAKKERLNNRALALSLKYKFVTPLTSMVVTKPDNKKPELGTLDENEDTHLVIDLNSQQRPPIQTHSSVRVKSRMPPRLHRKVISKPVSARRVISLGGRRYSGPISASFSKASFDRLRKKFLERLYGSVLRNPFLMLKTKFGHLKKVSLLEVLNNPLIALDLDVQPTYLATSTSKANPTLNFVTSTTKSSILPTARRGTQNNEGGGKQNKRGKTISCLINLNKGEQYHLAFTVFNSKYKFPMCSSINADEKDSLQLLKDKKSGITVNASISSLNMNSSRTIIDKFEIRTPNGKYYKINETGIASNIFGRAFWFWEKKHRKMQNIPGLKLILVHNRLTIEVGKTKMIVIKIVKMACEVPKIACLTMNVSKKYHLVKKADGVLGSIGHKKTQTVEDKRGRFQKKPNGLKSWKSRLSFDQFKKIMRWA